MCRACQHYKKEYAETQDIRQGKVDPDDFEKEVNYKPKKKVKTPPNRTNKNICWGNDGGPHVYVWEPHSGYYEDKNLFRKVYGYYKHEAYTCAGCGRYTKVRLTERYLKAKERKWAKLPDAPKGITLPKYRWSGKKFKYWDWEDYDPEYVLAYKEYCINKNLPAWLWRYKEERMMKDNTG